MKIFRLYCRFAFYAVKLKEKVPRKWETKIELKLDFRRFQTESF